MTKYRFDDILVINKEKVQLSAQRKSLLQFIMKNTETKFASVQYTILEIFQQFNLGCLDRLLDLNDLNLQTMPIPSAVNMAFLLKQINTFFVFFGDLVNSFICVGSRSIKSLAQNVSTHIQLIKKNLGESIAKKINHKDLKWTYVNWGPYVQLIDAGFNKFYQIGTLFIRIWGQYPSKTAQLALKSVFIGTNIFLAEFYAKLAKLYEIKLYERPENYLRLTMVYQLFYLFVLWQVALICCFAPIIHQTYYKQLWNMIVPYINDMIGVYQLKAKKNKIPGLEGNQNKVLDNPLVTNFATRHQKLHDNKVLFQFLKKQIKSHKQHVDQVLGRLKKIQFTSQEETKHFKNQSDLLNILLSVNIYEKKDQQLIDYVLSVKNRLKKQYLPSIKDANYYNKLFNDSFFLTDKGLPTYKQLGFGNIWRQFYSGKFAFVGIQQYQLSLQKFIPSPEAVKQAMQQTDLILNKQLQYQNYTQFLEKIPKPGQITIKQVDILKTLSDQYPPWNLGFKNKIVQGMNLLYHQQPDMFSYDYNVQRIAQTSVQARIIIQQLHNKIEHYLNQGGQNGSAVISYFEPTLMRFAKLGKQNTANWLVAIIDAIGYYSLRVASFPTEKVFILKVADMLSDFYIGVKTKSVCQLHIKAFCQEQNYVFDDGYKLPPVEDFTTKQLLKKTAEDLNKVKEQYQQYASVRQMQLDSLKTQVNQARVLQQKIAEKQKAIFNAILEETEIISKKIAKQPNDEQKKKSIIQYLKILSTLGTQNIQAIFRDMIKAMFDPTSAIQNLSQLAEKIKNKQNFSLENLNEKSFEKDQMQVIAQNVYRYFRQKEKQYPFFLTLSKKIKTNYELIAFLQGKILEPGNRLSLQQRYSIIAQQQYLAKLTQTLTKEMQSILQPFVNFMVSAGLKKAKIQSLQGKNTKYNIQPQLKIFFAMIPKAKQQKRFQKINLQFQKMERQTNQRIRQSFNRVEHLQQTLHLRKISDLERQVIDKAQKQNQSIKKIMINQLTNARLQSQKGKQLSNLSATMIQDTNCVWRHFFLSTELLQQCYDIYYEAMNGFNTFATNLIPQIQDPKAKRVMQMTQTVFKNIETTFMAVQADVHEKFTKCTKHMSSDIFKSQIVNILSDQEYLQFPQILKILQKIRNR